MSVSAQNGTTIAMNASARLYRYATNTRNVVYTRLGKFPWIYPRLVSIIIAVFCVFKMACLHAPLYIYKLMCFYI